MPKPTIKQFQKDFAGIAKNYLKNRVNPKEIGKSMFLWKDTYGIPPEVTLDAVFKPVEDELKEILRESVKYAKELDAETYN